MKPRAVVRRTRDYRIVHEKLVLEGYAEMVVLPHTDNIKHIAFNAKGLDVLQVLVDGVESTFERAHAAFHYSAQTPPQPPKPPAPVPAFDAKPQPLSAAAKAMAAAPKQIAITLNPDRKLPAAAAAAAAPKGAAAAAAARPRIPAYDLAHIRDLRTWEFAEFEQSDTNDYGQVVVAIPKAVRKQRKHAVKALEDDVDITSTDDLLAPFVVHVLYRVRVPTPAAVGAAAAGAAAAVGSAAGAVGGGAPLECAGVHFVVPDRLLFPARPAQFYVSTAKCDASLWFPCAETVTGSSGSGERCTFELEITCPAACVVVASGELSGQSYTDDSKTRKTYAYHCDVPVYPHSIGLCVAPFEVTPEPKVEPLTHFHIPWWSAAAGAGGGALKAAAAASAGGRAGAGSANGVDFAHSVSATGSVLFGLFEEYLGMPYPFPSYSQVFMDDTHADVVSFAGMSVFSSSLLHDKHVIDQTFKTRKTLAYGLAYSWLSHSLVLKSYADLWIVHGLAHYLTMLYIEKAFGNNESQWQQVMSALYVLERDAERDSKESSDAEWRRDAEQNESSADLLIDGTVVAAAAAAPAAAAAGAGAGAAAGGMGGGMGGASAGVSFFLPTRPLFWTGYTHPIEMHDPVMARKAGAVMKMLEQKIGKEHFQGLVRLVIAESSETTATAANAAAAAANTDADVKGAARGGAGAAKQPLSTKRLIEHAKRLSTEQDMKTFFDMWVFCDGYPQLKAVFNFNRKKHVTEISISQSRAQGLKFSGSLRLRIHEVNRSTEHERRVDDERQEYEFACASRLRRNRKRKQVVEDELGVEDLLQRNIETPVLWVRVDPYRQWFRFTELEQHEVMWVHQLNSDRDVVAQYEAIDGLRRLALASNAIPGAGAAVAGAAAAPAAAAAAAAPSTALTATTNVLSNALRDTLENRKYFVRIRAAAAKTLAETAMTRVGVKTHLDVLFHYFRAAHCERTPLSAAAQAAAAAAPAGTTADGVVVSLSAAVAASAAAANAAALGGAAGGAMVSPFGGGAGGGGANSLAFGSVVNAFGILKPNDFLELSEYYMKRAIAGALASVVDPNSRLTPPPVTRFLLFLLANNDNSKNQFSDSHYLAQLLRSVGALRFSKFDNVQPVWAELSRYLHYDQILPSFHNLVTSAVLESMAKIEAAGLLLEADAKVAYHHFATYGHFRGVRVSAFKCLVTLAAASQSRAVQHLPVVVQTLLHERVPGVQLAMAQAWLSIYSKMGTRLDIFRTPTPHNQYLMDSLWHMLNTCADAEFRWCVYRLYMCLWGRGLPSCVPAASPVREASRRAAEQIKRDKLHEGKHARRKFKARRMLKETRTKRGFGNIAAAAPAGAVKITLNTKGKLKATGDDRPDEDEVLDVQ